MCQTIRVISYDRNCPVTVTADLKLLPSAGSDRAWVWNPQADYADEEAKSEQLAIRFANAESE